jgi:hypothetical protein
MLVAGIFQILLTFVIPPAMKAVGISGFWFYAIPYIIMLAATLVAGSILVIYLTYNPKPKGVVPTSTSINE